MDEKIKTEGIRNHYSKIIADTLKSVWIVILLGVFNLSEEVGEIADSVASSGDALIAVLISIAVLAAIVLAVGIFNFLRWRKTYITIDDENLIVNNNYLFQKNVTTVRLTSIATVNFQQGILDRVFGTYRLQVDINSSVTADKTDFNLVFDKKTAEDIKSVLTDKSQQTIGTGSSAYSDSGVLGSAVNAADQESKLIYEFSFGQVVRHCVLSLSFIVIIITLVTLIGSIAGIAASDGSGIGAIFAVLIIAVPLVWSQIAPLMNYYGFKIEKVGDRAVVSYGLFTHRQYNLPLNKTNAIVLHQPIIARIFGYYTGDLINVGMGDEDNNKAPIFCLAVRKEEMLEIIKELKPELQIGGLGEGSPSSAYIPICIPYFIFGVIAVIVSAILGYWWMGAIVLVLLMLCALLSFKTKSLAILNDKAVITSGIFHKRTITVPNSKIQNISLKSGPIARRLGLSHGVATILASALYSRHEIGYFKTERFDALFNNIVDINRE